MMPTNDEPYLAVVSTMELILALNFRIDVVQAEHFACLVNKEHIPHIHGSKHTQKTADILVEVYLSLIVLEDLKSIR